MNCKPGDLARVISTPESLEAGVVDWFFVVKEPRCKTDAKGGVAWTYEGPIRVVPQGIFKGTQFIGIADHILRPIRDPGPEAVDEMVLKNPVRHAELA